jgi:hypothetical protein
MVVPRRMSPDLGKSANESDLRRRFSLASIAGFLAPAPSDRGVAWTAEIFGSTALPPPFLAEQCDSHVSEFKTVTQP